MASADREKTMIRYRVWSEEIAIDLGQRQSAPRGLFPQLPAGRREAGGGAEATRFACRVFLFFYWGRVRERVGLSAARFASQFCNGRGEKMNSLLRGFGEGSGACLHSSCRKSKPKSRRSRSNYQGVPGLSQSQDRQSPIRIKRACLPAQGTMCSTIKGKEPMCKGQTVDRASD